MISTTALLTCVLSIASPQELLQSAQTHIAAEQWEDAANTLDAYIASTENPAPSINYDRGIAYYQLKQYDQASKAFEDAMASTDDPTLASYCAYNFGNAVYQATMHDLEGTTNDDAQTKAIAAIETAKEQLSNTIDSYRRAIAKNKEDTDARANGELAWKMLQQLDEMQEEMEQQQKQQQDDQNQEQQQDEESAQEQADNQKNTEQGESDKESEEQQKDGEQSDSQDQKDSENQKGEKSEDQKEQDSEPSDQSEDGQQSEDQKEQDSKPTDQQQDGDQSEDQKEEQQGNQTKSNEQMNEDNSKDENSFDQSPSPEESDQQKTPNVEDGDLETTNEAGKQEILKPNDAKEEGERLSRSEASRLLQLIRDKEQQRRKLLAARRAARRVPVQKDW
jgi:hypothetical protein